MAADKVKYLAYFVDCIKQMLLVRLHVLSFSSQVFVRGRPESKKAIPFRRCL